MLPYDFQARNRSCRCDCRSFDGGRRCESSNFEPNFEIETNLRELKSVEFYHLEGSLSCTFFFFLSFFSELFDGNGQVLRKCARVLRSHDLELWNFSFFFFLFLFPELLGGNLSIVSWQWLNLNGICECSRNL